MLRANTLQVAGNCPRTAGDDVLHIRRGTDLASSPRDRVPDKVLLLVELETISTLIHKDLVVHRLPEHVFGVAVVQRRSCHAGHRMHPWL